MLISEIHGFITTIDDVVLVAPIIKEYMDTAVKNDEHLVKLAGVLQRIISKSQGESDESMLLSDEEKEELMGTLQDTVDDLQKESDRLEGIKNKTINQKDFRRVKWVQHLQHLTMIKLKGFLGKEYSVPFYLQFVPGYCN